MDELDLDEYRRLSGKWGLSLQFVQKEFKVMDAGASGAIKPKKWFGRGL